MPHLLFFGPPGTGKTSTILAMAKELWGPIAYKQRVLELNASDERGIKVIREKVKTFASLSCHSTIEGYPSPNWKLIILDEADSLTSDAQTALRRTMELYSSSTRFCLCCNYVSRIIEPLVSRCAKFRFKPIPDIEGLSRLEEIVKKEDIQFDQTSLSSSSSKSLLLTKFIRRCDGDLRKTITCLQTAHRLNGKINWAILNDLIGSVDDALIDAAISIIKTKNDSYDDNPLLITNWITNVLVPSGYSLQDFLSQFAEEFLLGNHGGISDKKLSLIAEKIGQIEHRMMDGADGPLQIMSLLSYCQWILRNQDMKINIMLS